MSQKPNKYKPIYTVRKSSNKTKQIQVATQKLSQQNVYDICLQYGFSLQMPQANALTEYLFLLQKWNQSMNLVGKSSWQDILKELVLDSLHLAKYLNEHLIFGSEFLPYGMNEKYHTFQFTENTKPNLETWDLGAGAGLPGIPLRILWNQGNYSLVEAREKRTLFLNMVNIKLGLENTFICRERAENFMQNKMANLIISRAFMPYEKMLPFIAPYLYSQKENGSVIFLTLEKIDAKKYNTEQYQWETTNIYEYKIQGIKRFFCEIQKIS